MVKTTVYLPDDMKAELERLSERGGRSEAELIRQAIAQFVEDERPPRPTMPLFRSGNPSLAERVDEALADFGS